VGVASSSADVASAVCRATSATRLAAAVIFSADRTFPLMSGITFHGASTTLFARS
jgi:hypothetical protein